MIRRRTGRMIKKATGDRANYGGSRSHAMIYDQTTAAIARGA